MIFHDACVYAFGLNFKKSFIKKIAIPTESEKRRDRYYICGLCVHELNVKSLIYYATFKVRKIDSFFYKINTCLQKAITCIGLQAEQIFSVNT